MFAAFDHPFNNTLLRFRNQAYVKFCTVFCVNSVIIMSCLNVNKHHVTSTVVTLNLLWAQLTIRLVFLQDKKNVNPFFGIIYNFIRNINVIHSK